VSVSSDEEFLRLPLEKAQAYADPKCTICLGDGTYGKGTQLVRCDCSRSQRGGGGWLATPSCLTSSSSMCGL